MHIDAKLSSAGIDIEQWIKIKDRNPEKVFKLPGIERILENEETIENLARLEHERWMADRRINGWCYTDKKKDSFKRLHPDLIPYEQLAEASRDYDRLMVKTLIEIPELASNS